MCTRVDINVEVSTDKSLLDVELIFEFLHNEARWCQGIPRPLVEKAIFNSLCFGAYLGVNVPTWQLRN
jgi:hypothetical protein